MKLKHYNKCVCCCIKDFTICTRIIAFLGIAVSVLLTTVLLNDSMVNNYAISRDVALGLGLDWRHIHPNATTSAAIDTEGRMISALLIFYIISYFTTNVLLLLAAILRDSCLTIPWLICEGVGLLSRTIALIYHLYMEFDDINQLFTAGSVLYIVIMGWWWAVVFLVQLSWRHQKNNTLHLNEALTYDSGMLTGLDLSMLNSQEFYSANKLYAEI